MDCKRTVIANMVLSTLIGGNAWADSVEELNWSESKEVTGHYHGIDIGSGRKVNIDVGGDIHTHANHSGVFISGNASATLKSSQHGNTLSVDNNRWEGIVVESGGVLNVDGMNVISNGNGSDKENDGNGIRANSGGKVNIKNASRVEFSGNKKGRGIFAYSNKETSVVNIAGKNDGKSVLFVSNNKQAGIESEDSSLVNIANMDLTIAGNGAYGVRARNGGIINISGNNHVLNVIGNNSADGEHGDGILAERDQEVERQSTIYIKDMNILVKDHHYQGIAARTGGAVNIVGNGANTLEVYNTRMAADKGQDLGKGIHAKESAGKGQHAQISIKDMHVDSSRNELEGLVAAHSGVIYVSSTGGENKLTANENRKYINGDSNAWSYGAGLLAHGVSAHSPNKQAAIYVENMNVDANNNGLYGLYVRDGGIISISGDGDHKLNIIGNKSTLNNTGDAGIAVDGLHENGSSKATAAIIIRDMEVTINDNGRYGINVTSGGQMFMHSTKDNTLTISGNQTGNADKNEGIGINVAGMFGETQSRLDIVDMNVHIDGSPDAGIKVSNGAFVNIVSSMGNNNLTANNSDNHGPNNGENNGAGLFAFTHPDRSDLKTVLNVSGMNVEAKNNGAYGVLSEGAYIRLAGNGTHHLDVDGNGKYGLLAKDGGSIDIAGMKVSGTSSDFALVGIEREGGLYLANSVMTTDNDTLFYTWSDEESHTGEINLKESVAIGKGARLAWFDSLNSVLNASHSWLENAIGTNTEKGAMSTVSLDHSTWLMKESSNITDLSIKQSLIDMRKSDGYNTLTLGSLSSENATYLLNTYFDEPGLTSDKIIVDGGEGTGRDNVLRVYSTGYAEDTRQINGYGIQVVNLDNAADKSVDFSLYGGVVDSGAYDYYLYRAVDDNYYLQTDYTPTTTAKAVTNIPAIHLSIVKSGLNEFRHRITELREHDIFHPHEVWVRSWGKHLKIDDTIESRMNLYGIEMGYDKEVHENEDNKYYAGIMAGYMHANNIKHHNAGYPDGSAKANTPGVGLYGVWDNSNGWYSYGTLRYFWSKMKAQNYSSAGEKITFDPDRNYIAATFELGKQYEDIVDDKRKWILEPKVDLGYAYAEAKSFKTNLNTKVHYGTSESFTSRAAVLFGYNSQAESGAIYEPFVELGVSREWLGKTDVTYAGGRFKSDQRGNGFDASVGLRAKTNENWSFIGNLGYEKGEVTQGFGAQLGVRYSW